MLLNYRKKIDIEYFQKHDFSLIEVIVSVTCMYEFRQLMLDKLTVRILNYV